MTTDYVTWPMEANVSPAALHHIAEAIDGYLTRVNLAPPVLDEMQNTANDIRSLLQHVVVARQSQISTEEWLDT